MRLGWGKGFNGAMVSTLNLHQGDPDSILGAQLKQYRKGI